MAAPHLYSRLWRLIKPPGDSRRTTAGLSKSRRHFHSITSKGRASHQSNEPEARLLTSCKVCTRGHFHSNERKWLNFLVMVLTSASCKLSVWVWSKLHELQTVFAGICAVVKIYHRCVFLTISIIDLLEVFVLFSVWLWCKSSHIIRNFLSLSLAHNYEQKFYPGVIISYY